MGLDDLTSELLLHVLEHLTPVIPDSISFDGKEKKPDRSALVALTYGNRRLNSFAIPLLYRDLWFPQLEDEEYVVGQDHNVRLIARTLLEDPAKRTLVQSVHVASYEHSGYASFWSPQCTDVFKTLFDSAFADHPDEHAEWTTKCVEKRKSDYILPLLLASLPGLRHLALDGVGVVCWQNLDLVARRLASTAITKHQPLSALRTVLLGRYDPKLLLAGVASKMFALAIVAGWQAVEAIYCWFAGDEMDERGQAVTVGDYWNLSPSSANTKILILKHQCKLSEEHLKVLLHAITALETFEYHIGYDQNCRICTASFAEALSEHSAILKNIALWVNPSEQYNDLTQDHISLDAPMVFGKFSSLESLTISIDMLLGMATANGTSTPLTSQPAIDDFVLQSFPPSLKELTIAFIFERDHLNATKQLFMTLIHNKNQLYPSLRFLTACNATHIPFCFEAFRHARREAAFRDIELRVSQYEEDEEDGIRVGDVFKVPPQTWVDAESENVILATED